MFIRYSLAMCAGGLFTGLAYYHQSKQRPFLISAQPHPVKNLEIKDVSEVISKTTKSHILNNFPSLSHVVEHGIPSYDGLLVREPYILSYNRKNKAADWVMEYLTKGMLKGDAKRKNIYKTDTTIHQYFRSTMEDYKSSGFDKGHLAKAENYKSSQEAMNETFLMSNMAPQIKAIYLSENTAEVSILNRISGSDSTGKEKNVQSRTRISVISDPKFNRYGLWRALEDHVTKLVKQKYGKYEGVYVCSGPLYLPRKLCDEQVATLLEEKENWKLTGKQETNVRSKHKQKKGKMQSRNEQEENLLSNNKENAKKRGECNDAEQKNYYVIYKVIGENFVAVPTHYFKVLLCKVEENLYDIEAYVIPNKPNDPGISKTAEDRTLKEITSNKPNDPKNSKTPEDRALKEIIRNKPNDPKLSKASEDPRLKDFLIPKEAIEKAAGFLIYPELEQSKIRRNKSKESASSEYYTI